MDEKTKFSKNKMKDLMKKQTVIEEVSFLLFTVKHRKKITLEIKEKREKRKMKRKERNISIQKLTSKGQPVMKHRIKLLLKSITDFNNQNI